MDCYFRQSWVDERLRFTGPMERLQVAINILDRIWKPDTHFFNGKRSYLHTVTVPNKFLRIYRDGRIFYSMRLTIKATCPMRLEKFPMDTQMCPLHFGSHGYARDDVLYIWSDGPDSSIKMASDMTLSQFDLIGFPAGNYTKTDHGRGAFSALYVDFSLRRHMGYFLINVYVPCSLLVVLSWVAFWINREATADRIALGVTTVLTMAFLGIDNRRDLPKVSYSTALDYFVGMCFAFVLATVIQFAGVHYFTKHGYGETPHHVTMDSEDDEEASGTDHGQNGRLCHTLHTNTTANGKTNSRREYYDRVHYRPRDSFCSQFWHCIVGSAKYRSIRTKTSVSMYNSVSNIDKVSRVFFPVFFIALNVLYWLTYLRDEDGHQQKINL